MHRFWTSHDDSCCRGFQSDLVGTWTCGLIPYRSTELKIYQKEVGGGGTTLWAGGNCLSSMKVGGGEPDPRILVFRDLQELCASHTPWRYRGLQILVLGSPDRVDFSQLCTTERKLIQRSVILELWKQKCTENQLSAGFIGHQITL